MFGRGWVSIITGIVLSVILVLIYTESKDSNDKAKDIIENGWYYEGTSEITQEQFDLVKQEDGKVVVTLLNPLTVEYSFGSISDFSFLDREVYGGSQKAAVGLSEVVILFLFVIPIIAIFSGAVDLISVEKK